MPEQTGAATPVLEKAEPVRTTPPPGTDPNHGNHTEPLQGLYRSSSVKESQKTCNLVKKDVSLRMIH